MIVGKRYIAMISNLDPKISGLVVEWRGEVFWENCLRYGTGFVCFILLSDKL